MIGIGMNGVKRRPVLSHFLFAMPYRLFRLISILTIFVFALSLYYRTTNQWWLKNLGDSFIYKQIGRRPIILSSQYRPRNEVQSDQEHFLLILFLADTLKLQQLYCFSGTHFMARAQIQRIHQGKRAANNVCLWSGFIAECQVVRSQLPSIRISTVPETKESAEIRVEEAYVAKDGKRQDLVVCMAPMYKYTDWYIMLVGIETWLATGASKIIIPIQSASITAYRILLQYQELDLVILRQWPKWPLLSDINPNGLILSRGIEESHVSCLHFVKSWTDMVVFTDLDDMLLPNHLAGLHAKSNLFLIQQFSKEYPRAGSFLFEHQDVQLVLPQKEKLALHLRYFDFHFLSSSHWKTLCSLRRMKTRVVVNASRVDSVNMHETGMHRFGYNQVRIPCRRAHFHHLRHSNAGAGINQRAVDTWPLVSLINRNFQERVKTGELGRMTNMQLDRSSEESFADFDRCMGSINGEHWHLAVSRCLTPHVCHPSVTIDLPCMASKGHYHFVKSGHDFIISLNKSIFVESEPNCQTPLPDLTGHHFYLP